ncbi:hypothetical protein N431DRAFT_343237 [Stipitochalara longipes BDJ]|nr:hypothetical protein N431DRAFT_343237 [Stipitochalara longipes BDJ]
MAKFTLFPKLSPELQRMIWSTACFIEPRIFEIEKDQDENSEPRSWRTIPGQQMQCADWTFSISRNNYYPTPSVLLVCWESYEESKRNYKLTEFRYQGGTKATWYNPHSDILYLGGKTCLGTMVALVESNIKFTRIAIDVGATVGGCVLCDEEMARIPAPAPFLASGNYLTRRLRVLHGFVPLGTSDASLFPGCGILNDIFLLMQEAGPFDLEIKSLFDSEIKRFDNCVGFEKYTEANPYYPRIREGRIHRTTMDKYIEQLIASTLAPMDDVSEKAWYGDKKPNFHLARRIEPLPEGQVFEIIALRVPGAGQHRMLWWKTHNLEGGSLFKFYPPQYSGPGDYIFKLVGSRSAVKEGRTILAEEIDRVKAVFKTKIAVIDPRQAVFPKSKTQP